MAFIDDREVGTKEERQKLFERFKKSLDAKGRQTEILYGIYMDGEDRITVKWVEMITQTTGNEGAGCWTVPDPKLVVDFKHEMTASCWGWAIEEFKAFEVMCVEAMEIDLPD